MNEDTQLLDAWRRHAAGAPGFIGRALRAQRAKAFLVQGQQRALIGILGEQYNVLWLRLQAMPLPRSNQFSADLARIVGKVQKDLEMVASLNLNRLEELIRAGLEE